MGHGGGKLLLLLHEMKTRETIISIVAFIYQNI